MKTITEFQNERKYLQKSLVFLSHDIKEYIKNPVETVSIDNLKNQFDFTIWQINQLDFNIKNILLLESEKIKQDLKNLEFEISLIPFPFDINNLPPYSSIFK